MPTRKWLDIISEYWDLSVQEIPVQLFNSWKSQRQFTNHVNQYQSTSHEVDKIEIHNSIHFQLRQRRIQNRIVIDLSKFELRSFSKK